jgi:hypothetical protein
VPKQDVMQFVHHQDEEVFISLAMLRDELPIHQELGHGDTFNRRRINLICNNHIGEPEEGVERVMTSREGC